MKSAAHWKELSLAVGATFALGLALPAAAVVITFDDVVVSPTNVIMTAETSGGFNFTSSHFHIINSPTSCGFGGCVQNGTQYAAEDAPTLAGPVTMAPVAGGTFSLLSFDGAEMWLDSVAATSGGFTNALNIHVVGNLSGGGTVAADFLLDQLKDGAGGLADFQSFLFGAGWTDLTSVVWSGTDAQGGLASMAFDNINASSASVPEPSTLLLIAAAMLGFAGWRRRASASG